MGVMGGQARTWGLAHQRLEPKCPHQLHPQSLVCPPKTFVFFILVGILSLCSVSVVEVVSQMLRSCSHKGVDAIHDQTRIPHRISVRRLSAEPRPTLLFALGNDLQRVVLAG